MIISRLCTFRFTAVAFIALHSYLVTASTTSTTPAGGAKPNIILIIADDYGWKDVGCYGSDLYETPHLDRLAADGVRFTNAYSACPVCSPSRAALLTGKYPARLHLTDWIPGQMPENPKLIVPDWTKFLDPREMTIARSLNDAGYKTASLGKWHLGGEESYPEKHGFDINIAGTSAAQPGSYFAPYKIATLTDGPEGEYLTDRLGDEAIQFIDGNKTKPFFLYLPHFAVHTPIQAKKPIIRKYREKLRPGLTHTNPQYAAMIESMDDTVGRIRARLDELQLTSRTIVIFSSDNGGRIPTTSNSPLRAGKGSCYEGGVRVPFIVSWPGVAKAGTVSETPVIGMDIFPTILEMAGQATAASSDGRSLVPLLARSEKLPREDIFWHYPHYQHYQQGGATPYGAVRSGDFKLIEFFDDMRVELYNLQSDPGEQKNVAAEMPAKADELRSKLHAWRKETGAQMPTKNHDYDPTKPEHDPKNRPTKTNKPAEEATTPTSQSRSSQTTLGSISLVPEKVPPVIADRQVSQIPDRVRLTGWAGTRIEANEANRLAKIDADRLLEGFRKRPGRQKWDGEHIGKWMHAATLAWANTGNPALRAKMDYAAAELVKCQLPDGYLGTYVEKERWTEWDVWAHKYNLIGLITYMRHTGNMEPLAACHKMADLLCNTFGDEPGKRDIIPAGQHMGMAPTSVLEPMVLLYRLTGEPRYLDFCKYILRAWEQPNGPKILSTLFAAKRVDKVGNAKAYEMLSCINGALEYYRTTGDRKILDAALIAWEDIVENRLYPTGAASYREFFHTDHDFPNNNNVGETCVTTTWIQFNGHLLRLTGEARFAEQLERVVLNQLFGAQHPGGAAWGYYVQMEGKKPYSGVLDGHCCLSSGPRGAALIPTFAVSADDDGVVVNLYDPGTARVGLSNGTSVTLKTSTTYPADEEIRVEVSPVSTQAFSLKLRIPDWCRESAILVNGETAKAVRGADGYHAIRREWKAGDQVVLRLEMEPRIALGEHKNENKFAVHYGPLVLAADETLFETSGTSVWDIAATTPTLEQLDVRAEPATGEFNTWPGARLFSMNAVMRKGVTDDAGQLSQRIHLVPFADAGITSGSYRIWIPYGTPRLDRNLLLDGIENRSRKPNFGSIIDDRLDVIASTQTGKRAKEDWYSVDLMSPVTIQRVVFVHGETRANGGWFDASTGKPRLEIKTSQPGEWQPLGELIDYPATTATDPAGLKPADTFAYDLQKPTNIYGIRVIGKPGSGQNANQSFTTCAELQAFGPDHRP